MKEEAEELGIALRDSFGDDVELVFVDVMTPDLEKYPDISGILSRVRLPLTAINGQPRFHGGLSMDMIADAIKEIKAGQVQN
ncbi:MAG: hypothetical protein AB1815_01400 [Bacillota bacterium]|jgi:hypothetical protein